MLINNLPQTNLEGIDFSDYSYCAYDLVNIDEVNEEVLFKFHCHPHICELNELGKHKLIKKQIKTYNDVLSYLKNK